MNDLNFTKNIHTKRFASGNPIRCRGNDHASFLDIIFFRLFQAEKNSLIQHWHIVKPKSPTYLFYFKWLPEYSLHTYFWLPALLGVRQTNVFQVTRLNTEKSAFQCFWL